MRYKRTLCRMVIAEHKANKQRLAEYLKMVRKHRSLFP